MDNTCEGNCYVTYKNLTDSVSLKKLSTTSITSGQGKITATGDNFITQNNANLEAVFENVLGKKQTVVSISTFSATSATFDIPNV